MTTATKPAWVPTADIIRSAKITQYMQYLREKRGLDFKDYDALWQWSVDDLPAFWDSIWQYYDIHAYAQPTKVLGKRTMPGAEWFPGATPNDAGTPDRHS